MTVRSLPERLARHAHAGQTDKAGQPYIGHVERVVANLVRRWPGATEDEIAAAWLHDVIEDTPWNAALLRRAGVSKAAVEIVRELTRPEGSTYLAWIQTLAAVGSVSAVRVKIADNEDNASPERVAAIPDGKRMVEERYRPARAMLEARIKQDEAATEYFKDVGPHDAAFIVAMVADKPEASD